MSFVSCGVNYETMYRKVANRITDKNTIISVLWTENQMMNDAFQAKIEEMKERMECFEREVTRQMEETNVKTQQMLENTKQMMKLEIRLAAAAAKTHKAEAESKIKREGMRRQQVVAAKKAKAHPASPPPASASAAAVEDECPSRWATGGFMEISGKMIGWVKETGDAFYMDPVTMGKDGRYGSFDAETGEMTATA